MSSVVRRWVSARLRGLQAHGASEVAGGGVEGEDVDEAIEGVHPDDAGPFLQCRLLGHPLADLVGDLAQVLGAAAVAPFGQPVQGGAGGSGTSVR